MAKNIKKTIKVTRVSVFAPNFDTMAIELVDTHEIIGGLGERLAISQARKAFGPNVQVRVEDSKRTYKASLDDFLAIANPVEDSDDESDEDFE